MNGVELGQFLAGAARCSFSSCKKRSVAIENQDAIVFKKTLESWESRTSKKKLKES